MELVSVRSRNSTHTYCLVINPRYTMYSRTELVLERGESFSNHSLTMIVLVQFLFFLRDEGLCSSSAGGHFSASLAPSEADFPGGNMLSTHSSLCRQGTPYVCQRQILCACVLSEEVCLQGVQVSQFGFVTRVILMRSVQNSCAVTHGCVTEVTGGVHTNREASGLLFISLGSRQRRLSFSIGLDDLSFFLIRVHGASIKIDSLLGVLQFNAAM